MLREVNAAELTCPIMRFLHHEHADITAALSAQGIDVRSVLFVKRRGRLHVQVPGRANDFVFFRRKVTRIDEAHEWAHRTDYFLGDEKAVGQGRRWEEVKRAFSSWLAGAAQRSL
jgi:hypothetical protein